MITATDGVSLDDSERQPVEVLTPIDFGSLDSTSQKWLRDLGLESDKSVIACNVSKQTVTFQTPDGPLERQVAEVWTRCMGYHRPVTSFNIGKKAEHKERKMFREVPAINCKAA